jgi:hypothetical protein
MEFLTALRQDVEITVRPFTQTTRRPLSRLRLNRHVKADSSKRQKTIAALLWLPTATLFFFDVYFTVSVTPGCTPLPRATSAKGPVSLSATHYPPETMSTLARQSSYRAVCSGGA